MVNQPNVVIFAYPGYTGGKFLINCLGLSDSCCFQDIHLVERQLNCEFSPQDKINYLLDKLDNTVTWQDLNLGDWQMFGMDWHNFTHRPELFNHNKLLFTIAHDRKRLTELVNKFPSSPRIYFTKNQKFLDWRFKNNSRNGEFYNGYILDNLALIHNWDSDDFLNKELFINKIKILYNNFKLLDFNQTFIEAYYDKYMATLEKLKHDSSH